MTILHLRNFGFGNLDLKIAYSFTPLILQATLRFFKYVGNCNQILLRKLSELKCGPIKRNYQPEKTVNKKQLKKLARNSPNLFSLHQLMITLYI